MPDVRKCFSSCRTQRITPNTNRIPNYEQALSETNLTCKRYHQIWKTSNQLSATCTNHTSPRWSPTTNFTIFPRMEALPRQNRTNENKQHVTQTHVVVRRIATKSKHTSEPNTKLKRSDTKKHSDRMGLNVKLKRSDTMKHSDKVQTYQRTECKGADVRKRHMRTLSVKLQEDNVCAVREYKAFPILQNWLQSIIVWCVPKITIRD